MTYGYSQKKYNKQTKQLNATILMTELTDFPRCPLRNTIDSQVLINDDNEDNVHGVVLAMEAPLGRRWFFAWTAPTTLTIPTLDRIIAWIFPIFVISISWINVRHFPSGVDKITHWGEEIY